MAALQRGMMLLLAKRASPCASAVFLCVLNQRLHLEVCLGDLTDEVLAQACPGHFDVRSIRRALVWLRRNDLVFYGRTSQGRLGMILVAHEILGSPRPKPPAPKLSTTAPTPGQPCPIRPSSLRFAQRGRVILSDALRARFSRVFTATSTTPATARGRSGGWVSAADVMTALGLPAGRA